MTRRVVLAVLLAGVLTAALPAAVSVAADPVPGDVDGDGAADLLVGSPLDEVRSKGAAGSFSLLFGSAAGVTDHDQRWHRDRKGVKGVAVGTPDDEQECCLGRFAEAVAYGDFDGDGFSDVAAAAAANPRTDDYPAQPAAVNVLYGSAQGLTAAGDQLWSLKSRGVRGRGPASFPTLASGDFDGDGHDDLVFFNFDDSSIHVLAGSADGLSAARDVLLRRGTPGVEGGGSFVGTFAVGDFDADGTDDLAAAANQDASGSVSVFGGGPDLLSPARDTSLSFDTEGVPGEAGTGDTFGTALAAGDFDGDGDDDLAVGASYYGYGVAGADPDANAGRVTVLHGSAAGLTSDGAVVMDESSPGFAADAVRGRFGENLGAGDLNGDGNDDLAVYNAGEVSSDDAEPLATGGLHVAYGSPGGLRLAERDHIRPGDVGLTNEQAAPFFAERTVVADYDGDGDGELTLTAARAVIVVYGAADGVDLGRFERWGADTPRIKGRGAFEELADSRWP